MKILVAGLSRIIGTSKTGSAFDMCNLHGLVPVEAMSNTKITIQGAGMKPMDIPLAVEAMSDFLPLASKMPLWVDLVTEARPRGGKFETVVIGIAPQAKAA